MHDKKRRREKDMTKEGWLTCLWLPHTRWKMSALLTIRVVLRGERQCEIKLCILCVCVSIWSTSCMIFIWTARFFFSVVLLLLLLLSIRLLLHFLPRIAHDKRNEEGEKNHTKIFRQHLFSRSNLYQSKVSCRKKCVRIFVYSFVLPSPVRLLKHERA